MGCLFFFPRGSVGMPPDWIAVLIAPIAEGSMYLILIIRGPQSPHIGSSFRPRYSLFRYVGP